ncbi:hypothetical protein ABG79_01727 [Caloramator mitchellensis]|uniref:Putative Se/S carrier protein-like domain-containing protein n=2 Tax=Caloramator mitchellensis TaxID=908809 RepID=A0A0R3JSN6_CALMK|nr:DUF3343 domain-containing protein [Caloramator mitchellensis]KRQ86518.1 hypothetical protein ABG79_01727 [Caloramator mitchellensis]
MRNYILFTSYNNGLRLSSILKDSGIKHTISPTPRELSTCCGISIMYEKNDEDEIKRLVEEKKVEVLGFFTLDKEIKSFYK